MIEKARATSSLPLKAWILLLFGCLILAFGWVIPSRFKSIPAGVAREAGSAGASAGDLARKSLVDGNISAATAIAQAAQRIGEDDAVVTLSQAAAQLERNPQLEHWGAWDPFLEAALGQVPFEHYSTEPGLLGVLIARPCREAVNRLLENSRNPLVPDLLETGSLTSYKRLLPVSSASGRPLEVTLLALALMVQGDHLSDGFKSDLRDLVWNANATGEVRALEDLYLDMLSMLRLFDWGQLKELLGRVESAGTLKRLRYVFHRRPDDIDALFTMVLAAPAPSDFLDYLASYGDEGFEVLLASLSYGLEGFRLVIREQLPVESIHEVSSDSLYENLQYALVPFSLRNPELSLVIKYTSFFFGAFFSLWGMSLFGRFYKESISPLLAYTQRFFGALASVLVFAVLSEPYLASGGDFVGYSFKLSLPVLAQVDGELQVIETTPTTSMETGTLLSIAFFFLLQALVFLICMLKVREIEKRDLDSLVKLRLMENEENLFDSGLYVGIAGTCISLVMQVINLVEHNLLAAYSSNLFGILCVAIVKIRLVRPYKTRLIMDSEDHIASLATKTN